MEYSKPLELWGGVECTVNRVRNQYFDQLKSNRHDLRIMVLTVMMKELLKSISSSV